MLYFLASVTSLNSLALCCPYTILTTFPFPGSIPVLLIMLKHEHIKRKNDNKIKITCISINGRIIHQTNCLMIKLHNRAWSEISLTIMTILLCVRNIMGSETILTSATVHTRVQRWSRGGDKNNTLRPSSTGNKPERVVVMMRTTLKQRSRYSRLHKFRLSFYSSVTLHK